MNIRNQIKYFLLLTVYFVNAFVLAQDIHFSQYNMSPLNLNPAFTGLFDGDYRVGAIYRSQWSSVPVPYSTVSLMADRTMMIRGKDFGAGLLFNNDVSGTNKYSTTQLYIPLSYITKINGDSNLVLSIGVQPGISSIGFKTNKQTFDSQFDGDAYNPALPTNENFPSISKTYFDAIGGFLVQYQVKPLTVLTAGLSLSHLNQPKVSFFKNPDIRLDPKIVPYFSVKFPVAPRTALTTEIMYEKQGKFHETVFGARAAYTLNSKDYQVVSAGVYTRLKDAVIMRVGYDYKQWQFGMSYDINTSAFVAATNRRGAIEFALIYIFKKENIFIPKKRVCPIYM